MKDCRQKFLCSPPLLTQHTASYVHSFRLYVTFWKVELVERWRRNFDANSFSPHYKAAPLTRGHLLFRFHGTAFLSEGSGDAALLCLCVYVYVCVCGEVWLLISYLMGHADGCSRCVSVCLISFKHGRRIMTVVLWNVAAHHYGLDLLPDNETWVRGDIKVFYVCSLGRHATT